MRKQLTDLKSALKAQVALARLAAFGVAPAFFLRLFEDARALGWLDSARTGIPADPSGESCPWYTFSALHFLRTRKFDGLHVFEFGSGNSTLWWSKMAATVTSVEHDRRWFETMRPKLAANVAYVFKELAPGGDYCREVQRRGRAFDIVVVDGRDRVNCMKTSLSAVTPRAVVICDNSDREQYAEGFDALADAGYRRLDFFGFGPVNAYPWMTSIFYKDGNCLGI